MDRFHRGGYSGLGCPSHADLGSNRGRHPFYISLKSDGGVYSFGTNASGQLGLGNTVTQAAPAGIPSFSGVAALAAGDAHSLALKTTGTVHVWGKNTNGQLGDGLTANRTSPFQLTTLTGIIAIAAGDSHSLALKSNGTVWAWGLNTNGQLGIATTTQSLVPVQVKGVGGSGSLTGIIAIAAGASHSMALKSDGTVYVWGLNGNGQLGDGSTTQRTSPVLISSANLSGVTAIAAGDAFSIALKSDGTVRAWGLNSSGQLGDTTTTQRTAPVTVSGLTGVTAICAGDTHGLALKSDGTVRAWGLNSSGQLGDASTVNRSTPVQLPGVTTAVSLAAGTTHTHVLLSDGRILSYGENTNGQLGDGLTSPIRLTPVQPTAWTDVTSVATGASHTLAVRASGTAWAWGLNTNGQLGDGSTTLRVLPVQLTTLSGVSKVAAGAAHSLALRSDGTLRAWGLNSSGQLGDASTTQRTAPVTLSTPTGATAIAAGDNHSLALKSNGTVWVWGLNTNGQLGDGLTGNRTAPFQLTTLSAVSSLAAGNSHSLALKSDGTLYAWGLNSSGQLGDNSTSQRTTPVQVKGTGGSGFLTGVAAIAAAGTHSLALKTDGTLWAWGKNTNGQLGDNSTTQRNAPVQVKGVGGTGFLTGVIAVAAGETHSLAVLSDGTVRAWGLNSSAQLGNGTLVQSTTPVVVSGLTAAALIASGDTHTLALRTDQTLRAWGNHASGQLGSPVMVASAVALSLKTSAGDSDADGLPDAWEVAHWGNLAQSGTADPDADGLTNVQENLRGTNPTQPDADLDLLTDPVDPYPADYYNALVPTIVILSGNAQTAPAGQFNPLAFDVAVWNSAGTVPLVNAPVTFSVLSGGGQLAVSAAPPLSYSLVRRTDVDGSIEAFYQQPGSGGVASQIRATAGTAEVTFNTTSANPDSQAPTVPSGLASASVTATSFTLTWTASTDNTAVTAYDVYLGGVLHGSTAGSTSYAVTGRSPATASSMTVRARDAAGNASAQSSALVVTTTADTTAPSVPSGLVSSARTMTGFTLSWNASTDDVAVAGYDIYRDGALLGSTTSATSYAVSGLAPNTVSAMTVRSRDAAANASAQSTSLNVSTLADTTAPTTPGALVRTGRTDTTISLSWTASTDNVAVASYELYDGSTLLVIIPAPAASFTVTGLTASTAYNLKLRAKDTAGNTSSYTSVLVVYTLGAGAPGTVSGLKLWLKADATPAGALATWRDQSGLDNHASQSASSARPQVVLNAMNGKSVVRFDGTNDFLTLPNILAGATQGEVFIVNRLQDFTNQYNGLCQFGVQNGVAYSEDDGNLIWEDFGINDSGAFPGPGSAVLTSTHIYNASIDTNAVSNVRFDGRLIKIREGSQVEFTSAPLIGNDAYNEFYRGDIAEVIVFDRVLTLSERNTLYTYLAAKYAPPSIVVPATPALTALPASSTQADLAWTLSSGGDQHVTATLERQTGAGTFVVVATLDDTFAYTDSGLSPGTTYSYRVKLASYAGESAYSNTVTLTTLATYAVPASGLRLWLRSTAVLQSTDPVSVWPDRSGLFNDATQSDPARQPVLIPAALNGYPVLRFDGEQGLDLPELMAGATAGEIIAVLKVADKTPGLYSNNNNDLWDFGISTGYYRDYVDAAVYYHYNGFGLFDGEETDGELPIGKVSDYHIFGTSSDGTNWTERYNGVVHRGAVGRTVGFPNQNPNLGTNFVGDFAEILIYDRVLTPTERTAIHTYLAAKYAPPGLVVPETPVLGAHAASSSRIDLSWSGAASSNQHLIATIERRIDGGAFEVVAAVENTSSYTDSGLISEQAYTYRVKLTAYGGSSAYSNSVVVSTLPGGSELPPAGLRLWLRASAGLPPSGLVAVWPDQSGLLNDATQTNPARRPLLIPSSLNDYPVLRFDGEHGLELPDLMAGVTAGEIIAVLKVGDKTPGHYSNNNNDLWNFGRTTGYYYDRSGFPAYYRYNGFGLVGSHDFFGFPKSKVSSYHIYDTSSSPAASVERYNGIVFSTLVSPAVAFSNSTPWLGKGFVGDFAEIIIYDRALTQNERDSVHTYLAGKYAPSSIVPPSAPVLTLSRVSWDSADLAWTAPAQSDLITTAILERKIGLGDFAEIARGSGLTTFKDLALNENQSYTYRVRLKGYAGLSNHSNEVQVTTGEITKSGLMLWLNAASLSGGAVQTWTDLSGSAHHATQSNSAHRPSVVGDALNGFPVVSFDGVDDHLNLPNVLGGATEGEILAVVKVPALAANKYNRMWTFGTASGSTYYNGARFEDFGTYEDNLHDGSPLQDQYHVVSVSIDQGFLRDRINERLVWEQAVVPTGFNPLPVIGGSPLDASIVFNGEIAELFVYNRALTKAERQFLSTGLVGKYALASVPSVSTPVLAGRVEASDKISLTWTAVASTVYVAYTLERKVGEGAYEAIAELENVFSFTDSSVQAGTNYSYRIKAKMLSGVSGYSNESSFTTPILPVLVNNQNGSSASGLSGNWIMQGPAVVAQSLRGSLVYNLPVNIAGLYALDVTVRDAIEANPKRNFFLDVNVDGRRVGSISISASGLISGVGRLQLPWLNVGAHTLELVWRNGTFGSFIKIENIALVVPDGTDADNNGEADWISPYLTKGFSFDSQALESYVSPVTVEGKSPWPAFVAVTGSHQTIPVTEAIISPVKVGLTGQFYADVTLDPSATTTVTVKEAGGLRAVSRQIAWRAYDLRVLADYVVSVKTGSSVLFQALDTQNPAASYTYRIQPPAGGATDFALSNNLKIEQDLSIPGDYKIYALVAGQVSHLVVTIQSREIILNPAPAIFQTGSSPSFNITWTPPSCPPQASLKADPGVYLSEIIGVAPRKFILSGSSNNRIIGRMGDQAGPIVDALELVPVRSYHDELSSLTNVAVLPDGTYVYRATINLEGPIPPNLVISLNAFAAGAIFENGSQNKTITAADFDAQGVYSYYIYRPGPGAKCHSVSFKINGATVYSY